MCCQILFKVETKQIEKSLFLLIVVQKHPSHCLIAGTKLDQSGFGNNRTVLAAICESYSFGSRCLFEVIKHEGSCERGSWALCVTHTFSQLTVELKGISELTDSLAFLHFRGEKLVHQSRALTPFTKPCYSDVLGWLAFVICVWGVPAWLNDSIENIHHEQCYDEGQIWTFSGELNVVCTC